LCALGVFDGDGHACNYPTRLMALLTGSYSRLS
jgi:hypothetical protein